MFLHHAAEQRLANDEVPMPLAPVRVGRIEVGCPKPSDVISSQLGRHKVSEPLNVDREARWHCRSVLWVLGVLLTHLTRLRHLPYSALQLPSGLMYNQ